MSLPALQYQRFHSFTSSPFGMIAVNANDTFYADPLSAPFLLSDSATTRAAPPPTSSGIDPKILLRSHTMRVSNELSSDMTAGELEDIILRAASSSAVQNGVALPSWSLDFASDAVVPAATAATSAGGIGGGFSYYYTAQADAGSLPQSTTQNAPQNTAPQQYHQEWSNGGAWTNSGREYQAENATWVPADFQEIRRQNASTIATAFHGRTDDDFANGGEGIEQPWSHGAGATAAASAAASGGSHAARHGGGGGFDPSHLPAILRSLTAHQQAVEALAPLATESRRQTGQWDGRAGEGAVSAAAGWRSSPSLAAAAATTAPPPPGFLPTEGVFPPLPLTRQVPAASFQCIPPSAALAAAFPASSSSASSAHLAASVAASLAGKRLALVAQDGLAGGGTSFETSQEQKLPQAIGDVGVVGGGMVAEASAKLSAEQNPSAIDALASMILVAAAAAGGQGGGLAGQPQGMGGAGATGGGIDGPGRTGETWEGIGGGMGGGMVGGMIGGVVGGEGDEWRNGGLAGKEEAYEAGGMDGDKAGYGYGYGDVDAILQRRNTASSGTRNTRRMGNMGDMIVSASAGADGHWHSATATETGTTNVTATATAGAAAKRVRRSSSSGSVPPPLHHSHEDTCPAAAALESAQKCHAAAAAAAPSPLKSSPQTLRLPAAASAALPLNAPPNAPSAFETSQTVSGAFPQHIQTPPNAPSPFPTSPPPAATPPHPPRSSFPPSGPSDSPLVDEKPDAVAQAAADAGVGRKRQVREETRKRGRGSERGGGAAGGRQHRASEGTWEEGGAGRRKQQGGVEAAWEVRARDGAAGGATAAVGGFEEGEDAEGTRVLGRVSGACLAARKRRERIASQMRTLQRLVPGSSRVDTVSVLSDTIRFLCSLIHQIQSLGAEPEGYSTTEAAEAAAAEVQKLIRDGVIASHRPVANQRAPSQGVTAADPAVAAGAAVAADGAIEAGRAVAASGAVASPNAPQGSTHTSSQGPSQSLLPTVSATSPSLDESLARGDGDADAYGGADADGS
ncbi:unnamed protein product [Closterium sp. Naga37s-1]|nr:unnamed protein product [Closterium sp. Naga37s-1]